MTLPNLFFIGLNRAGTTSMADTLSGHPDIFLSEVKEPNYFTRDLRSSRKRIGLQAYHALFEPGRQSRYRLDASVMYLLSDSAAQEIKAHVPDAKILLHLREPYGWLKSTYILSRLYGDDWASPDMAATRRFASYDKRYFNNRWCFEGNFYIEQYMKIPARIEEYRRLFGAENVHIVFYDDLEKNTKAEVDKVIHWLGLSSDGLPADYGTRILNSTAELKQNYRATPGLMLFMNGRVKATHLYRIYKKPKGRGQRMLSAVVTIPAYFLSCVYTSTTALLHRLRPSYGSSLPYQLSAPVKAQLAQELEPALQRLESLTGRNLAHWRQSTN